MKLDKSEEDLSDEKKRMILKTIEIRLDGVGEATTRARITFIITIIASSAMLITLWNTYHSWTRRRGFDDTFLFKAEKVKDEAAFNEKLKNANKKKPNTEELKNLGEKITKNILDISENRKEKKLINRFIETINERILTDEKFYTSIDENELRILFCGNDLPGYSPFCQKTDNLIKLIREKILHRDISEFYKNGNNHLNKLILEKVFPEIEWKGEFSGKGNELALFEYNKRALSSEWIENQNVRISPLGISVNVDQFSFLGSITLTIISFWMLFSLRRENRSIVSLLRDVRSDVNYPRTRLTNNETDSKKEADWEEDAWDIANMTYHGIAQKLIFAKTGTDEPMSTRHIFKGLEGSKDKEKKDTAQLKSIFNLVIDQSVVILTKLIRAGALILLFLPVITIILIILDDYYTTTNTLYPYYTNPASAFIERNIKPIPNQINYEIYVGLISGGITLLGCFACLVFQIRTGQALRAFERELKSNKAEYLEKKGKWER